MFIGMLKKYRKVKKIPQSKSSQIYSQELESSRNRNRNLNSEIISVASQGTINKK